MNKLEQLKKMTDVVADSGDIEAIAKHKPEDATTNPSLLLKAAKLERYASLLDDSCLWALERSNDSSRVVRHASERFAVCVGNEILNIIPGRVSTEVDARLSFDTKASIATAERLVELYQSLGRTRERLLIKLAATWEGVEAARYLEENGIQCNLTLLFSDVQAVAAAEAGAFLISPFVGRILDWHKKQRPDFEFNADNDPGVASVRNIYRLFKQRGYQTVVMGASFRNVGEIEALAGCDRLTISPELLSGLAADTAPLERQLSPGDAAPNSSPSVESEAQFRYALNQDAMATEKLAEGIRGFVADQVRLEVLLTDRLHALR